MPTSKKSTRRRKITRKKTKSKKAKKRVLTKPVPRPVSEKLQFRIDQEEYFSRVKKQKPSTGYFGKTISAGTKFEFNFVIHTSSFHDDIGIFSKIVFEIEKKIPKGIKSSYIITRGTLLTDILLYLVLPLSSTIVGAEIHRVLHIIKKNDSIEKLRIKLNSKEVLARNRLIEEGIVNYVLSEPNRIRGYHNWTVTLINGRTLQILVYDNGETELLQ